jgi:molybdate transport system permease protein
MWDATSAEALQLSIRVSAVATLAIVLVGSPLALWMARRRTVMPRLLESALSLPLVVPPVLTGYVFLMILSPRSLLGHWLESLGLRFALDWKGAVVASAALAFPLFLAVARVAFEKCDRKLEDAARTLNACPGRVLFTVTLPLALPGLLAAAAVAFARAFGEFGATMMLAGNIPGQTRTVPQAIYTHLLAGREKQAWGLALVSVAVGVAAMAIAQLLARRRLHPFVGKEQDA